LVLAQLIEFPSNYYTPRLICDATESNTEGFKAQAIAMSGIVKPVMVMAMKEPGDAQTTRQLVDRTESVRVAGRSLVRYQHLSSLFG